MSKLFFHKKDNFFKLTFFLLFSGFSFILFNFLIVNKNVLISSFYEELMVFDLGFSSLGNLVDEDGIGSENISKYKKLNALINHLIKYPFTKKQKSNALVPLIEISIPYQNLNIIYKDRLKGIEKGFLKNAKWTKGLVKFENKEVSARIRLKGLLSSHWEADKRFSLRIKLNKNKSTKEKDFILGMKSFSLHKLRSRQYPYENIFHEILPQIGLNAVTHKIVKLKVNGINWGYMDMQEHFSNTMLEKNKLKDSLVISFNDEVYWSEYSKVTEFPLKKKDYWLSNPRLFIDLSGKSLNKLSPQEILYFSYITNSLIDDNYQEILFSDSHLNTAIEFSRIWGNYHALSSGNAKFYFNPFTLKLEPLMSDQGPFKYISKNQETLENSYSGFLNSEKIKNIENNKNNLLRTQIIELIKEKTPYKMSNELFPYDLPVNTKVPELNYSYIKNNYKNKIISNINTDFYKKDIVCKNNRYELETNFDAIKAYYDNNNIYIHNLLCGDVKIKKVKICNTILDLNISLDKDKLTLDEPYIINQKTFFKNLNKHSKSANNSYFFNNLNDCKNNYVKYFFNKRRYTANLQNIKKINKFNNPLLKENIGNYIERLSNDNFLIRKGIYEIKQPIVLYGNLKIEEGTNLKFSEKSYLIVRGNISINGKMDQPVTMTSLDNNKTWKGLYIYNENIYKTGNSYIENLNIKNISELDDGILNLTGGINFYNLNLDIKNLNISNSKAEDALNIVKSELEINELNIKDTKSDAFDCDFCNGSINNLIFKNIGGDGLDLSGSLLKAKIIKADNINDKVVSVGEKTNIKLDLKNVTESFVAVAVKDSSNAEIKIENINTFGPKVMSYIKKPFYEGETKVKIKYKLKISDIDNFNNDFLSSKKTTMVVNDKKVINTIIDVKNLYEKGPMKKN